MNSSNTGPLIISGIFKSILCDALAGLLCNELNTLYNSVNNLEIYKSKKCLSDIKNKMLMIFIPKNQKMYMLGKQRKTMRYIF